MTSTDGDRAGEDAVLGIVASLRDLSRNDWLYADLYLERAEALLAPVFSRDRFRAMAAEQEQLPRLASDLRRALEQAQWDEAQRLAEAGAALRRDPARRSRLLEVAKPIYGQRRLVAREHRACAHGCRRRADGVARARDPGTREEAPTAGLGGFRARNLLRRARRPFREPRGRLARRGQRRSRSCGNPRPDAPRNRRRQFRGSPESDHTRAEFAAGSDGEDSRACCLEGRSSSASRWSFLVKPSAARHASGSRRVLSRRMRT